MDTSNPADAGGPATGSATDRIVKEVLIRAPRSQVWRALTDHEQFGAWFKVALDGPFTLGQHTTGHMTYPGYEHLPWDSETVALEPQERFAFRWPVFDHAAGRAVDLWTLVEFRLADAPDGGTLLTISESGFDAVPEPLRSSSFRSNSEGWSIQAQNVRQHVEG